MVRHNPVFFLGAIWEILRFFSLFLVLTLERTVSPEPIETLILLWFASSELAMSGGFLMIGIYPGKYDRYAGLLALGKFLCLLPGAGVVFIQASIPSFVQSADAVSALARLSCPLVIVLLDLLFFVFLLSYKRTDKFDTFSEDDEGAGIGGA